MKKSVMVRLLGEWRREGQCPRVSPSPPAAPAATVQNVLGELREVIEECSPVGDVRDGVTSVCGVKAGELMAEAAVRCLLGKGLREGGCCVLGQLHGL